MEDFLKQEDKKDLYQKVIKSEAFSLYEESNCETITKSS